jgi:gamma-glutamyltranspeptidase / glutathione hydrolase
MTWIHKWARMPVIFGILALVAAAPYSVRGVGIVATDHPLSAKAGVEVLARGGNAVDAAVAAALSAGVVQPAGSGLGGGGFAVVVQADGSRSVLDFREVAPRGASRDMFLDASGEVEPRLSRASGLAVGVPGESRGLMRLVETWGRLSPREVAAPAIRQAVGGTPVGEHLAQAFGATSHQEVTRAFFSGGSPLERGDRMVRARLARTLRRWAASRGEDLYTGAGAAQIVGAISRRGGVMTSEDLRSYTPMQREPITVEFMDHEIVTMPPPSSGGIVLAQLLRVLEGYDLAALGHNSSDYIHLLAEAMKHAYADRAHHMGDPDFVEVPVQRLLSDARVAEIRHKIWPGRTFESAYYGALIAPPTDGGTTHISVVDRQGMAVALTSTINTSFGSGIVAEDLGVILNNEMDDFSAQPGIPNAYGLIGAEANAVEAGKRPLSSMTPTVILDADGRVKMSVGGSGGSHIISSTLQVVLNVLVFGMEAQEAVSAPRFHHQWQPDTLFVEGPISLDVERALVSRGHKTARYDRSIAVQAVARDEQGLAGGSDPRKGGWPAAQDARD